MTAPAAMCIVLFAGVVSLLLAGFPVAFTLSGGALLVAGLATGLGAFDPTLLAAFPQRIFAIMRNEVLVAVPLFVFMGVMLEKSGIAEELLEDMGRLFGRLRGGLGISVCLVGALLAASTGIVGATVVTMGLLSLPAMLRRGYDPAIACGTVCAAGTLGQLIPPSIVLVLLGDQLSSAYQQAQFAMGRFAPDAVSVNDLFAGALLPGLVLVALYIGFQVVHARLRLAAPDHRCHPDGAATGLPGIRRFGLSLLAPLALMVAVLGSILAGIASPSEAAAVGAIGALMLAGYRVDPRRGRPVVVAALCAVAMLALAGLFDLRLQRDRIEWWEWTAICLALLGAIGFVVGITVSVLRVHATKPSATKSSVTTVSATADDAQRSALVRVMRQTLLLTSMIFAVLIGASLFSLVFRGLGGDTIVETYLTNLPGGTLSVLLLVMLTMFLLGFVLDFLEIVFIVVPVVAPILLQLEITPGVAISPVWLGVMMAVNLQASFLTPPFGFSLFYLRGVAPASIRTTQIYRGVIPFVAIQLSLLVVLWWWPQLATWLPETLYGP